ncbi:MAG: ABC transporter permease [Candidatus Latescibacterota bacterium]
MLRSYVKLALKVFLRRRFYAFVSLLGTTFTLATVVAAAMLLYCYVGARAPEVNKERTLKVGWVVEARRDGSTLGMPANPLSYRFASEHVRALQTPERVALLSATRPAVAYAGEEKVELALRHVDAVYWEVLRFRFLEGRAFTGQEDADGEPVAVISRRVRERLFGGGSAVGQVLEVEQGRFRVVGVVADVREVQQDAFADAWVPIGAASPQTGPPSPYGEYEALLLARRAADIPRLKAEYQAPLARVAPTDPRCDVVHSAADTPWEELARSNTNWRMDGWRGYRQGYHKGRMLLLWTAVVLLFMSLPALNMLNLNLSRMLERAPEIGVRRAFGAPRRSLVLQFIVENVLLTLMGGVLGFLFSFALMHAVAPEFGDVPISWGMLGQVLGVGLASALAFGLLSGAYPAWRMSRLHPATALRGGER